MLTFHVQQIYVSLPSKCFFVIQRFSASLKVKKKQKIVIEIVNNFGVNFERKKK